MPVCTGVSPRGMPVGGLWRLEVGRTCELEAEAHLPPPNTGTGMPHRLWQAFALAGFVLATPVVAEVAYPDRDKRDIDLYALMSGKCETLKIAGQDFQCKAMAFFHSEKGRANFTVA